MTIKKKKVYNYLNFCIFNTSGHVLIKQIQAWLAVVEYMS